MPISKKNRPNIQEVIATIKMSNGTIYKIDTKSVLPEFDNIIDISGKDYNLRQQFKLEFTAKELELKVIKPEVEEKVEETPKENK